MKESALGLATAEDEQGERISKAGAENGVRGKGGQLLHLSSTTG